MVANVSMARFDSSSADTSFVLILNSLAEVGYHSYIADPGWGEDDRREVRKRRLIIDRLDYTVTFRRVIATNDGLLVNGWNVLDRMAFGEAVRLELFDAVMLQFEISKPSSLCRIEPLIYDRLVKRRRSPLALVAMSNGDCATKDAQACIEHAEKVAGHLLLPLIKLGDDMTECRESIEGLLHYLAGAADDTLDKRFAATKDRMRASGH